jgi:hypothetical protein
METSDIADFAPGVDTREMVYVVAEDNVGTARFEVLRALMQDSRHAVKLYTDFDEATDAARKQGECVFEASLIIRQMTFGSRMVT